ncbi:MULTISPECIES: MauE/DoxX family redox-associated membrane protein [Sphingobacterium]|uniref:MauE/DoxX family redox-associated membrane protein n=1 Tax=Sphingobacterium TaxID=28453 RepID=UPI00257DE32E|nr:MULTISPECIES: MauE/DoxX family redox-associated membrane protein [Sphingobacterium]
MKRDKIYHWTYQLLRCGIILFWLYVGMDKIWIHDAFELSLVHQPLIGSFAPVLSWLMPLLEISLAVLLFMPHKKLERLGWSVSLLLILIFSIYIALGVFGILKNAPCMCSSFLTNVNRITHLWINALLFILTLAGLFLSRKTSNKTAKRIQNNRYKNRINLFLLLFIVIVIGHVQVLLKGKSKNAFDYPMQGAPFPNELVEGLQ